MCLYLPRKISFKVVHERMFYGVHKGKEQMSVYAGEKLWVA